MSTYLSLPFLFELLESDFLSLIESDSLSLTIKEEFLLEVFFVKRQKLASTKVCEDEVVPEEPLLDDSSFFEQEMRERLKNADRKMKIIFFIFQLITKVS